MLNKHIRLPLSYEQALELELDDGDKGDIHITVLFEGAIESSIYLSKTDANELCVALKDLQDFVGRGN